MHGQTLSFDIATLAERILRTSPLQGLGWLVTVKAAHGAVEARLRLNDYGQVAMFDEEMARRGYEMMILDPDTEADFVFVPASARADGWARS